VSEENPIASAPAGIVTARAGAYYRNARFLLALGVLLYGAWNIYDGFVGWPHDNDMARKQGFDKMPHSDTDLLFNRVLGIGLPPGAVLLVWWTLHNSRGEFRLEGQVLNAPRHPPVPLANIESLDKAQWDRKGVAVVTYKLADGRAGKFKLDDFVYQREGIDEIYRRIELSFQEPGGESQGGAA